MAHGLSCSEACGILLNPEPLTVCPWSPLSLLWTLCPQLHCRSPHSLSFLFSLPPKKCCFLKEADLSSLTGIRPMALHWQADSLLLSHQGRFSIYSLDYMPCKTLKAALKDLSHRVGLRAKWDYACKLCTESREWSTLFSVTWMKITILYIHFPSHHSQPWQPQPLLVPHHGKIWGNPEPLTVCPWSLLFLLWTLYPHLHFRSPHSLSFLFSLPPKKCCFWKEADLSSLSLFFFLIVGWQTSSATGDSSSITKYIWELFGKCGLFLGHRVAASSKTQADVKMDPRGDDIVLAAIDSRSYSHRCKAFW